MAETPPGGPAHLLPPSPHGGSYGPAFDWLCPLPGPSFPLPFVPPSPPMPFCSSCVLFQRASPDISQALATSPVLEQKLTSEHLSNISESPWPRLISTAGFWGRVGHLAQVTELNQPSSLHRSFCHSLQFADEGPETQICDHSQKKVKTSPVLSEHVTSFPPPSSSPVWDSVKSGCSDPMPGPLLQADPG